MKYLNAPAGTTRIGLAFGPMVLPFLEANPGLVDYIEMPFEQLRHDPDSAAVQEIIPVVLHCASMSVAGFVRPTKDTLAAINREASRTRTPWIGEHLAYISADALPEVGSDLASPTNLTYTVSPQLSEDTVERVALNLSSLQSRFNVPLILENPPLYFHVPGSTLSMVEFIDKVVERCDVGLLLDLTHFLITMLNSGADAAQELERMPLDRVVEIHISGLSVQSGLAWDDHATPAPSVVFELLDQVLERVQPRALTFEYNWSPDLPHSLLRTHIECVRSSVGLT